MIQIGVEIVWDNIDSVNEFVVDVISRFSRFFMQTVNKKMVSEKFVYIIKRKLHGCLKI